MDRTVRAATAAGVTVGAHPVSPTLPVSGVARMAITADEARDLMHYQVGALVGFLAAHGVPGYGLAGTAHESTAATCGVAFVPEFYVDLDYSKDGSLIVEGRPKDRTLESLRAANTLTWQKRRQSQEQSKKPSPLL